MNSVLESAVAEVQQASERLLRSLEKTPDERLDWAPSASARNALQLVAHSANSLGFIAEMFLGTPYPTPTTAEADAEFLELEKAISTREQALALWHEKMAYHVSVIEGIRDDQLDELITLPFNLGQVPLRYVVNVGAVHTCEHLAQLDYLQTIYGDRSW